MRKADQFKTELVDEKNFRVLMVCAVWEMTPRRQVYIGAADIDALSDIWVEVTGTLLQRHRVQYVYIEAQNKNDATKPAPQHAVENT